MEVNLIAIGSVASILLQLFRWHVWQLFLYAKVACLLDCEMSCFRGEKEALRFAFKCFIVDEWAFLLVHCYSHCNFGLQTELFFNPFMLCSPDFPAKLIQYISLLHVIVNSTTIGILMLN